MRRHREKEIQDASNIATSAAVLVVADATGGAPGSSATLEAVLDHRRFLAVAPLARLAISTHCPEAIQQPILRVRPAGSPLAIRVKSILSFMARQG